MHTFSNGCPFDYRAFVISWKVGIPLIGLTKPVGWLSLLQLTAISQSALLLYNRTFWWQFCVVTLVFLFSVCVGYFVIGLYQISVIVYC